MDFNLNDPDFVLLVAVLIGLLAVPVGLLTVYLEEWVSRRIKKRKKADTPK